MSPNEIFKTLCDDAYHTQDEIITTSTTPGTPQCVWIKEYLNALRTTAEVFASTPELTKLTTITLGYFVHDCRSRGSVSLTRDKAGKPLRYECYQLPEYVCAAMVANDIGTIGGPLRAGDGKPAEGKAVNGEALDAKTSTEKVSEIKAEWCAAEDNAPGRSAAKEKEADGKTADEIATAME